VVVRLQGARERWSRSRLERRRPVVLRGYRRILVPLVDNDVSAKAIDVACRLASERGGSVTAVAVVVVEPLLPLDCRMDEEESRARRLLERAGETCASFGVNMTPRLVRARDAGAAILAEAEVREVDLLVLGAGTERRLSSGALAFGGTIEHVLKGATFRVMVVTAPAAAEDGMRAAAVDIAASR
jgi:basic amino acid/polyamine antiporter, APA family